MLQLVMKGMDFPIKLLADNNSTIEDFLKSNGLLPRDGGLRFALDQNDNIVTGNIADAPNTIYLGLPDNIVPIWVERVMKNGIQTITNLENGEELFAPGLKVNEHCHVYVSRKYLCLKSGSRLHGYRFRTAGEPYHVGDYIYAQAPKFGNEVRLFDPSTGKATLRAELDVGRVNIEAIRNLWCICKFNKDSFGNISVIYQPNLTYIPPGFKPFVSKPKESIQQKNKRGRRLKGVSRFILQRGVCPWGKGLVKGKTIIRGKETSLVTVVAGNLAEKHVVGRKVRAVRDKNGNKMSCVNSYRRKGPPLQKNDTLHIKVPLNGNMPSIFNPLSNSNDLLVQLHLPPGVNIVEFRERWIVGEVFNDPEEGGIIQVRMDIDLSKVHV